MNELLRKALFLPDQASTISLPLDHLHFFVILTTFGGVAFVFAIGVYFAIRYRRRTEDDTTPKVVASRAVELLYVFTPLALFLVWFFIGFNQYIRLDTPPPNTIDIYVTAKQWMWKFSYPGGPNSVGTLRVPVGRPVRLLITSRDVIHSFFVPAFRLKKDAVPGRYTEMWFTVREPGRFQIFCAEYCGLMHSAMWGEVVALDPIQYDQWLAAQRMGLVKRRDESASPVESEAPEGVLVAQGKKIAEAVGCINCHTVDGRAHIGPTWLDLYMRRERLSDGSTVVADEAYLTESMMEPEAKIVAGFQPIMPTFQGRLDAAQTAAIVEYIKSLRTPGLERVRTKEPVFERSH